jgi:four helix bundle protein
MGNYRNLAAWQRAMDLCDEVYVAVRQFPKQELFVLSQQMRSAALSIPSLIAEGQGRYTIPDQRHFTREARGSVYELQTQIEVAVRQKFITAEDGAKLMKTAGEVGRRINALLTSLTPNPGGPKDQGSTSKDQNAYPSVIDHANARSHGSRFSGKPTSIRIGPTGER